MPLWLMISGFVLMGVCAAFATLFLLSFYKEKFVRALIYKGCAGACFVIFGGACCLLSGTAVGTVVFIGLCFGLIGDELIALCQIYPAHDSKAFLGGGSCFLVGHVLYIAALFMLGGASWLSLLLSLVLISVIGGIYAHHRGFLAGEMRYLLMGYLTIVILVTATAIAVFVKQPGLGVGLFAIGGALFTVSDNILFAYKMGRKPRFLQNTALHVAYYLAQFSIAWSICLL